MILLHNLQIFVLDDGVVAKRAYITYIGRLFVISLVVIASVYENCTDKQNVQKVRNSDGFRVLSKFQNQLVVDGLSVLSTKPYWKYRKRYRTSVFGVFITSLRPTRVEKPRFNALNLR